MTRLTARAAARSRSEGSRWPGERTPSSMTRRRLSASLRYPARPASRPNARRNGGGFENDPLRRPLALNKQIQLCERSRWKMRPLPLKWTEKWTFPSLEPRWLVSPGGSVIAPSPIRPPDSRRSATSGLRGWCGIGPSRARTWLRSGTGPAAAGSFGVAIVRGPVAVRVRAPARRRARASRLRDELGAVVGRADGGAELRGGRPAARAPATVWSRPGGLHFPQSRAAAEPAGSGGRADRTAHGRRRPTRRAATVRRVTRHRRRRLGSTGGGVVMISQKRRTGSHRTLLQDHRQAPEGAGSGGVALPSYFNGS